MAPRLARRSPLRLATKLCPRCLTPLTARSQLGGWLVPQDYYCSKCGYAGTVFLEREGGEPLSGPEKV
ncbi:MAG TPA: hypothetical protein VKF39_04040 [Nitrososphaerales archaeon]|nr:hypothetical protein [Nitrososphaerales archaeon]